MGIPLMSVGEEVIGKLESDSYEVEEGVEDFVMEILDDQRILI